MNATGVRRVCSADWAFEAGVERLYLLTTRGRHAPEGMRRGRQAS
jgi:hypothetical protein